jgi:resuscitation-promoting factor RpfA
VAEVIAGSDAAIEGPPVPSVEAVAEAAVDAATATPVAAAYAVDESVLAILREEAEREANARRADTLESQTDLGIDAAMPRKAAALAEAEAKPSARRDLLPDVEEINSTLRPSDMQADGDGTPDFVAPPPEAPRGFRSGFLSLMTVAILAAALYLVAPRLAVLVPGLAGPLETYVSVIDSMRLGLDGMMRSATVAISDG